MLEESSLLTFGVECSINKEFDASKEWEWANMPEYINNGNNTRDIIIHFETDEDIKKFSELIGQKITEKTKFIWYPEKERQKLIDWIYVEDKEGTTNENI
jgi:hypothetical protein